MKRVILTDAQMRNFADKVRKTYPWSARCNTIYRAELISRWEVEIRECDAELLKGITD